MTFYMQQIPREEFLCFYVIKLIVVFLSSSNINANLIGEEGTKQSSNYGVLLTKRMCISDEQAVSVNQELAMVIASLHIESQRQILWPFFLIGDFIQTH